MKTRDDEINFYAEVTSEEFENEFLEKQELMRLLAEEFENEANLSLETTITN